MYEEAGVDQRVLRVPLVAARRLLAALPARKRVAGRFVDADVPIFENAVENVLTCADVLVGDHEARQPHRSTYITTEGPPPWRFCPPEEKGQFSSPWASVRACGARLGSQPRDRQPARARSSRRVKSLFQPATSSRARALAPGASVRACALARTLLFVDDREPEKTHRSAAPASRRPPDPRALLPQRQRFRGRAIHARRTGHAHPRR